MFYIDRRINSGFDVAFSIVKIAEEQLIHLFSCLT